MMKTSISILFILSTCLAFTQDIASGPERGDEQKNIIHYVELKVNPLIFFNAFPDDLDLDAFYYQFSLDFPLSEKFSLELELFNAINTGGYLHAKRFTNPKIGNDRFYLGASIGSTGGLLLMMGYNLLDKYQRVSFDLGFGVGRILGESIDDGLIAYGRFMVGYRFGNKNDFRRGS